MNRRLLLALLLWFVAFPAIARAQTPEEMLTRVEQKYDSLKSISASFSQRFQNGEQVLQESGTLAVKKPGKMHWEYKEPQTKYFLVDGKKSWFYVPRDNQVIVTDIRGDASAPLLLLFGRANLSRDFTVAKETGELPVTAGNWLLRLTPRVPQGDFSHVILEITPQTSMISRLSVVDPIGGRNDYMFTDIKENQNIPDQIFKLKLPARVEIIKQ